MSARLFCHLLAIVGFATAMAMRRFFVAVALYDSLTPLVFLFYLLENEHKVTATKW